MLCRTCRFVNRERIYNISFKHIDISKTCLLWSYYVIDFHKTSQPNFQKQRWRFLGRFFFLIQGSFLSYIIKIFLRLLIITRLQYYLQFVVFSTRVLFIILFLVPPISLFQRFRFVSLQDFIFLF